MSDKSERRDRCERADLYYSAVESAFCLGEDVPEWITHGKWRNLKRNEKREWKQTMVDLIDRWTKRRRIENARGKS